MGASKNRGPSKAECPFWFPLTCQPRGVHHFEQLPYSDYMETPELLCPCAFVLCVAIEAKTSHSWPAVVTYDTDVLTI